MRFLPCFFRPSLLVVLSLVSVQAFGAGSKIASFPISFEENRGQASQPARYVARAGGMEARFAPAGVQLHLPGAKPLTIRFTGMNAATKLEAEEPLAGRTNYLIGADPAGWLRGVPSFGRVTYAAIYPGIDLVFYGNGGKLEHDFVVSAGADAGRISLRLSGEKKLTLLPTGDVRVGLDAGAVFLEKPVAYQTGGAGREAVEARFVLARDGSVQFRLGAYDHSRALVIDPALDYSTYLDKNSLAVAGVAVDSAGATYITGYTFNSTYAVTGKAYEKKCAGCSPAVFITKLNPAGTAQEYSTFLGGTGYNQPFGIAVDGKGNAIVTGYTESTDFPELKQVSPAPEFSNGSDEAFVSSLTPDGSALNYSSVLGGGYTISTAVAVDAGGNAYITGITDSAVFPATEGALHFGVPHYPEGVGFVTKFLPSGALGYSALIGDTEPTNGGGGLIGTEGIAVDSKGSAYITGGGGTNWPTTQGAYLRQIPGESPFRGVFVTKLSPDGSELAYSTFLGAGGGLGIALDAKDDAFVTGDWDSTAYPVTANAFLAKTADCCAFLSEVGPDGTKLLYSTLLGSATGYGNVEPYAVAVDGGGSIWVAGETADVDFPQKDPLTPGPSQPVYGTSTNGYLSRFDPTGTKLEFSTFWGTGPGVQAVAIDAKGIAHFTGTTLDIIETTPGAFLRTVTPTPPDVEGIYGYAATVDVTKNTAVLCVSPPSNSLSFPVTPVDATSTLTLQATNCGTAELSFTSIASSSRSFAIPAATNGCKADLAPNASCSLVVAFTPTAAATYGGVITFESNATDPTITVPLSAAGAYPVASLEQSQLGFPPNLVGQSDASNFAFLQNAGKVPLAVSVGKMKTTGDFAIASTSCPASLFPGSDCGVSVTFTPTAVGSRTGTLTIPTNDPANRLLTLNLTGTGLASYPAPTVTALHNPTYPATAGSATASPVTVLVQGTNFFGPTVVKVDGEPQKITYSGPTVLSFVLDSNLLKQPGVLPVTVETPGPGGGVSAAYPLTVYQSVPITGSAMVYGPSTGLLYVAIPAAAKENPNTVIPIDPLTGALKTPIAVGKDPNRLAVSSDGTELYVASVAASELQRFNLKTLKLEKTFALPVDPEWGKTYIHDMQVVPGSPESIVVALLANVDPAEDGAALYNNSGLVNWIPGVNHSDSLALDSFTFTSSPNLIYGLPEASKFFSEVGVGSKGLTFSGGTTEGFDERTGSIVRSDGSYLYTNSGEVWNPTNQKLVGTYPGPSGNPLFYTASVVPDLASARTYFLDGDSGYSGYESLNIDVYNRSNFSLAGLIPFSNLYSPDASNLVRWGADGFAFLSVDETGSQPSANQLILVRSSLAYGVKTAAAPKLTSITPNSVTKGGASLLLEIAGTGFTPGSVAFVNGDARETAWVSATELTVLLPASDLASAGALRLSVRTPPPGGGTSAALTITVKE